MTHESGDPRGSYWFRQQQAALRRQWEAQRAPCWICTQPIDYRLSGNDTNGCTLDHVVPLSVNPEQHWNPVNWKPAHRGCNLSKGNRRHLPLYGPDSGPSRRW